MLVWRVDVSTLPHIFILIDFNCRFFRFYYSCR